MHFGSGGITGDHVVPSESDRTAIVSAFNGDNGLRANVTYTVSAGVPPHVFSCFLLVFWPCLGSGILVGMSPEIPPHFLENALSSCKCLIYMASPRGVEPLLPG